MGNVFNLELMLKVRQQILDEPQRFDMTTFVSGPKNQCATTACIAGWAIMYDPKCKKMLQYDPTLINYRGEATELLGITFNDANELFYLENWPSYLRVAYLFAETPEGRRDAAVQMIDRFIEKKTGRKMTNILRKEKQENKLQAWQDQEVDTPEEVHVFQPRS